MENTVVIYTKTGCPYCEKLKQGYCEQGIQFREINLSLDPAVQRLV